MTSDEVMTDATAPPARPADSQGPPLKVLLVCPTLEPGHRIQAPVEFANALKAEGVSVMFAAAIGTLRPGLLRTVAYCLIDNAEGAPVKAAHELSHLMRHHRPDVVHAHGMRCAVVTAVAASASRIHCARVMTHLTRQLRRMPRFIKAPMLRKCADRYFAVSDELKAELESLGVPSERIVVGALEPGDPQKLARASIAVYKELLNARGG